MLRLNANSGSRRREDKGTTRVVSCSTQAASPATAVAAASSITGYHACLHLLYHLPHLKSQGFADSEHRHPLPQEGSVSVKERSAGSREGRSRLAKARTHAASRVRCMSGSRRGRHHKRDSDSPPVGSRGYTRRTPCLQSRGATVLPFLAIDCTFRRSRWSFGS